MGHVKVSYKKEFIDKFKEAYSKFGLKQSNVLKKAMQKVINETKKNDK